MVASAQFKIPVFKVFLEPLHCMFKKVKVSIVYGTFCEYV